MSFFDRFVCGQNWRDLVWLSFCFFACARAIFCLFVFCLAKGHLCSGRYGNSCLRRWPFCSRSWLSIKSITFDFLTPALWVWFPLGCWHLGSKAYALVQGDRDTFGQEAVDTLIKEMEDKRANFIAEASAVCGVDCRAGRTRCSFFLLQVICAGYEEEMDEFFNSNPGFKRLSRPSMCRQKGFLSKISETTASRIYLQLETPQDCLAFFWCPALRSRVPFTFHFEDHFRMGLVSFFRGRHPPFLGGFKATPRKPFFFAVP